MNCISTPIKYFRSDETPNEFVVVDEKNATQQGDSMDQENAQESICQPDATKSVTTPSSPSSPNSDAHEADFSQPSTPSGSAADASVSSNEEVKPATTREDSCDCSRGLARAAVYKVFGKPPDLKKECNEELSKL